MTASLTHFLVDSHSIEIVSERLEKTERFCNEHMDFDLRAKEI